MDDKPLQTDTQTLRLLIRDEVTTLLEKHALACPFIADDHKTRLRLLENRFSSLVAWMLGTGVTSGASAFALSKIFG